MSSCQKVAISRLATAPWVVICHHVEFRQRFVKGPASASPLQPVGRSHSLRTCSAWLCGKRVNSWEAPLPRNHEAVAFCIMLGFKTSYELDSAHMQIEGKKGGVLGEGGKEGQRRSKTCR